MVSFTSNTIVAAGGHSQSGNEAFPAKTLHYSDVIMNAMASQTTSLTIVYSTVYWGADQMK